MLDIRATSSDSVSKTKETTEKNLFSSLHSRVYLNKETTQNVMYFPDTKKSEERVKRNCLLRNAWGAIRCTVEVTEGDGGDKGQDGFWRNT